MNESTGSGFDAASKMTLNSAMSGNLFLDETSKFKSDAIDKSLEGISLSSDDVPCLCLDCMGEEPRGRWYHASINLTVAVIGTGVLALPQAFAQLNFIESVPGLVGSVVLVAAFVMNWYASLLLSSVHYATKEPTAIHPEGRRFKTFLEVSEYTLGKKWTAWLFTPMQFINLFSTGIAYMIAAGQNSQGVYVTYSGDNNTRTMYWTTGAATFQLVLCLFPSLESFKIFSSLGAWLSITYSIISITLCIIMHGTVLPEPSYESAGNGPMDTMFSFFVGISTITFLFGVQSVQPDIQASLSDKHKSASKEYMMGLNASYLFTIPLYFLSALTGYLTFGRVVNGDILLSISQNSTSNVVLGFVSAAQAMVVVHVVVAYQIWAMPMYTLLEEATMKLVPRRLRFSWYHRIPVRFSYVAATWFFAIALPFFGDIMALNGALTIVPLCFIGPCVFYVLNKGYANITGWEKVWMGLVIGFNTIVGVFGTVAAIRQIVVDASTYKMFA